MVKATDTKSSARPAAQQQQSQQPFFNKEGSPAFSPESTSEKEAPAPFFVQRKLSIGQPNDPFEKEADAVADKVVQRLAQPAAEQTVQPKAATAPTPLAVSAIPTAPAAPATTPESLQKKEESEGKEEEVVQRKPVFDSMADAPEEKLQRKPIFDSMAGPQEENLQRKESDAAPETAHDGLQQRLENTKGSGQSLPAETRNAMESSIGADFSGVRVHTGQQASSLSNELGAQAFTHGNNIYFNEGKYDPAANSGQHLLAHELTHTVQQGAAIQKKADLTATPPDDMIQKAPAKGGPVAASGEVVNISGGAFHASAKLKESIKAAGKDGLDINITGGAIAGTGTMKVYEKDGAYESKDQGYLPLKVPLLQAANPMLAVRMKNGQVSGFGTIGKSRDKESIPKWFRNNGNALGWLSGVDVQRMQAQATNEFTGGAFTYRLNNIKVKVGGFADASMDLVVVNGQLGVQVSADMDIKGMAKGNLTITLKDNTLSGEGTFGVNFSTFTGEVAARFMNGALDVKGTVGYEANRLKGSLTLVMTDKATADNLARGQLKAAGNDPAAASLPAEIPAPGDKPGPRALAGMGTLAFQLTEWLTGSVNVIVDGKGDVTVVGEIAPPKEIILFEQKDYTKELFKLEARAAYGLPVIGNVFVFANMALSALAKVGPAKIYDIKLSGTYSTDPDIAQHITLSGALNMSAYAGLRLRAEGGAGLEVLDHDLKVGVGVNADAGVKGYVEARPSITYRDPGEFFFKGHMEIAAQPFLGLSGDLFVEIDSPWWSPLPDKKWTWPIGSLEYPLPGEFGIGADMEYVLGSGKVPEITFSEAKFDGQKFMTDLVDDNVPKKGGGGKGDKQGKFVDGGPDAGGKAGPGAGKAAPGAGKGGAPQTPAPAPGGGKGKDKKGKGDEKIEDMKSFAEAMKAVKSLEQRTKPMTRDEITTAVESIKKRFKVQTITFAPQGTEWWVVTGSVKDKPNKQSAKVKALMTPGDEKEKKGDEKEKQKQLDIAVQDLKAIDASIAGDGKMEEEEANKVAQNAKDKHKNVFKSISVIDAGEKWNYHYIQKAENPVKGSGKEEIPARIKRMKPSGLDAKQCKKLLAEATGIVGELVIANIFTSSMEGKELVNLLKRIKVEDEKPGGLKKGFRIIPYPMSGGNKVILGYFGFIGTGDSVRLEEAFTRPFFTDNEAYVKNEQLFLDLYVGKEVKDAGVKGAGKAMFEEALKFFKGKFKEIHAQWVANPGIYKSNYYGWSAYYGWSDNLASFIKNLKSGKYPTKEKAAEATWTGSMAKEAKYKVKDVDLIPGTENHFKRLNEERPWKEAKPPEAGKIPPFPEDTIQVDAIFVPEEGK